MSIQKYYLEGEKLEDENEIKWELQKNQLRSNYYYYYIKAYICFFFFFTNEKFDMGLILNERIIKLNRTNKGGIF